MFNNPNLNIGIPDSDLQSLISVISSFPDVEDIIIYGSRAKGTYRKFSDIDITLVGQNLSHTDLFPIMDKIDDLNLPYETDISIFDEIDYEPLRQEISKFGISLK